MAYIGRHEAAQRLRFALKTATGRTWRVYGDRGTAYGWLTVTAPKARCTGEFGYMNDEDCATLGAILSPDPAGTAHRQGYDITPDWRPYAVEKAETAAGIVPGLATHPARTETPERTGPEVRGLICDVYRSTVHPQSDFSAGGISAHHTKVTLIGPAIDAVGGNVFAPNADRPAVQLSTRTGIVSAVPDEKPDGTCGPMFGGSFIYTSDSRFDAAVRAMNGGHAHHGAVPLHDRFETPERYAELST